MTKKKFKPKDFPHQEDQEVTLSDDDVRRALEWWRNHAPDGAEGLLDAISSEENTEDEQKLEQ